MKNLLAMSVCALLVLAGASQGAILDDLQNAYYMGNSANDSSTVVDFAGGNDLNVGSGATLSIGTARLSFPGDGDTTGWSPFDSPLDLPDDALTIEIWIDSFEAGDPDEATWPYIMGYAASSAPGVGGETAFGFRRGRSRDYMTHFNYAAGGAFPGAGDYMTHMLETYDDSLHQLVATFDEDGTGFIEYNDWYLDGVLITQAMTMGFTDYDRYHKADTGEYTLDYIYDMQGVGAGWDPSTDAMKSAMLSGEIAAINIWGRSLSPTEISDLFDGGPEAVYEIPEPMTLAVLALGGLAALIRRRRQ